MGSLIAPTTDIKAIAVYSIAPLLTILVGLFLYALIKKIAPTFAALITGNRK
jgi:hypothetical protein